MSGARVGAGYAWVSSAWEEDGRAIVPVQRTQVMNGLVCWVNMIGVTGSQWIDLSSEDCSQNHL